MVSGKKILVSFIFILVGMGTILLGWLGRTSYENQINFESCRTVCPENCQPMPQSIITPFRIFFKYFWVFMMIGSILIGLAIGRFL